MAETLDPELIEDGLDILSQGEAEIIVTDGEKNQTVTDPAEGALDAAYFALIRAGFEPASLATTHSKLKYRLAGAIERRAKKRGLSGVDHQG